MAPQKNIEPSNSTASANNLALLTNNTSVKSATSTDTMTPPKEIELDLNLGLEQTPALSDAPFPFMKLSPELRNRIYEYAFDPEVKRGLAPHALTRTSRQVRGESLEMYYSLVELIEVPLLSHEQDIHFEQWLKTDLKRYSALPHLAFIFPSSDGVVRLEVCCTRLFLEDSARTIWDCELPHRTVPRQQTSTGGISTSLKICPGGPFRDAVDRLYDSYAALPGVRVPPRFERYRAGLLTCAKFFTSPKTPGGSRLDLRGELRS